MPQPLSDVDRDMLEVRKVEALERLAGHVEVLSVAVQQLTALQMAALPAGRGEELDDVLNRITERYRDRPR